MSSRTFVGTVNWNYRDPAPTNAVRITRRAVKDDGADDGGLIDAAGRSPASRVEAGEIAIRRNIVDESNVVQSRRSLGRGHVADVSRVRLCVVVNPSTAQFDWSTRKASASSVNGTACHIRSSAKKYGKINTALTINPAAC